MKFLAAISLTTLIFCACAYDPTYNGAACGQGDKCPTGYSCVAGHCLADADEPVVDADADAGADSRDGADPAPADDAGGDAGDEGIDSGDEGIDAGDESIDAGDEGGDDQQPCGGACSIQGSNNSYCDTTSNTCKQCHNDEHCGDSCAACEADAYCDDTYEDFCCKPACDAARACQIISCDYDWVCRITTFDPVIYEWKSQGSPFCSLSEDPGPVDAFRSCEDDSRLRFYCPFDGLCDAGACGPNPVVDRFHDCADIFGCDAGSGRCRMHLKDGQTCSFNFDCESFCCSRDQNPTCIPYDAASCKIFTTQYWDGVTQYTWTANTDDPATRHDLAAWSWAGGHNGARCDHSRDCDSGNCRYFTSVGGDRCDFQSCVNAGDASNIRNNYFCPAGDHDQHMAVVTNGDPIPLNDDCPP